MQKVFTRLSLVLIVTAMVTLCCTDEGGTFEVTVIDPDGYPVEGATIEGVIDYLNSYRVYTDNAGVAHVPGFGRDEPATIYKDNYLPRYIESLEPATYVIDVTTHRLRQIDGILGRAVLFDAETIVTVYGSQYLVYAYDDQSVTQVSSDVLAAGVGEFKLYGDTLWFSTYGGIYAYSIENITQPQLLFYLQITGNLGIFAVKDSIVAVGLEYGGALRIFSYDNTGHAQQLFSISEFIIKEMEFIGNYLVVVGGESSMPTVIDLVDPARPVLVYNHYEPNAYTGFIRDTKLIVVPEPYCYTDYTYEVADLSVPWSPSFLGSFTADAWLFDLLNGEYAVGYYKVPCLSTCILSGHIDYGFNTIAILPAWQTTPYRGGSPPYFILGESLWIIEPN